MPRSPDDPSNPARSGETAAGNGAEPEPKLPHERDESTKPEPGEPRKVIRQAHDDVESGQQDTDRGTPADDAYQKQKS